MWTNIQNFKMILWYGENLSLQSGHADSFQKSFSRSSLKNRSCPVHPVEEVISLVVVNDIWALFLETDIRESLGNN